MLYTILNGCPYTSIPAGYNAEHSAVTFCSNHLYSRCPTSGSYSLLDASVEGYNNSADAVEAVWRALEFPLTAYNNCYYINNTGSNDIWMRDWLARFGFSSASEITFAASANCYFPEHTTTATMGSVVLPDVDGARYTQGFTANSYAFNDAAVGVNWAFIQSYADPNVPYHFVYLFTIFPESFIWSETWNFNAMDEAPNHAGDSDWRKYAIVRVDTWEYTGGELSGKFNATVSISPLDVYIGYALTELQGKDTGPLYDTERPPLQPKDEGDTPPGRNTGGNGSGANDSDPVKVPGVPSTDMTQSGSLRVYEISAGQLKILVDYLHSNAPGDAILKWFGNPIQGIISLHYLPYALLPRTNPATTESVTVLGMPTGATATPIMQFQQIHFGSYLFLDDTGTYLDYAPYTKVSIYLPGIGIRELNIDDVINKRIWVVYNCDNVTGQFQAFISTSAEYQDEKHSSVRYSFSGQVAAPFPISQENWGNTFIAGATLAAGALAGGVAAAGSAAAAGSGAGAAAGSAAAGAAEAGAAGGITASGIAGGAVNIGNSLTSLAKPSITRSGTVSGTTSLFGVKKPYLIVERPNWQSYRGFASVKGYPCGQYWKLGDISGYAVIESCHLSGIPGTVGEINEIEALLKGGVIL